MIRIIKKKLYFVVAWYFRIFAEIKLRRWNPRVIVVTGSTGKTTLFHLVESQLGSIAKYSHHANSAIGIPFDILGLHRRNLTLSEWPLLFLKAPFKVFSSVPKEKIYVVEADCDRPYEGDFLSSLLHPEVTLWTGVGKTHSENFEHLVLNRKFDSVERAIAFEFGYFVQRTSNLCIVNADDKNISGEMERTTAKVEQISSTMELEGYNPGIESTSFKFKDEAFTFAYLLPEEVSSSILMSKQLTQYLGLSFDRKFIRFNMPPARNSVFKGVKNTTIVDSTYNSNLVSMRAILNMFSLVGGEKKWVVVGDMLEQGSQEISEHKKLAELINGYSFDKVILMGPRVSKYTKPKLRGSAVSFIKPREVLEYLEENIKGGEIILFKGARFLEGVIEKLLINKKDVEKLGRREKVWQIRRKKWGL